MTYILSKSDYKGGLYQQPTEKKKLFPRLVYLANIRTWQISELSL